MARPARFERTTTCLEGRCSIQLSYGRNPVYSSDDRTVTQARGGFYAGQALSTTTKFHGPGATAAWWSLLFVRPI